MVILQVIQVNRSVAQAGASAPAVARTPVRDSAAAVVRAERADDGHPAAHLGPAGALSAEVGHNGVVIDGDPLQEATPALLQRAGHLAVLRILAVARQEDLDRLATEADALSVRGYTLDPCDSAARLAHVRSVAAMNRRLSAAAAELQAANGALREAILDDAWTPADDPDGFAA